MRPEHSQLELDRDARYRELISDTIAGVFADLGGQADPDTLASNIVLALRQTSQLDLGVDEEGEPLWPPTARVLAGIKTTLEQTAALQEATGGYSVKINARKTGASIYVTFGKPTDVMTSLMFCFLMEYAPGILVTACRTLLAAAEAETSQDR